MLEYSLNETLINDVGVQVRYSKEFYDTHNWDPFLQNVDVLGTAYCLKNSILLKEYCLKNWVLLKWIGINLSNCARTRFLNHAILSVGFPPHRDIGRNIADGYCFGLGDLLVGGA